jgi:hypothetical protein
MLIDFRNTIDYYDQLRPIYQAIDEGHLKYGSTSSLQGHGLSGKAQ